MSVLHTYSLSKTSSLKHPLPLVVVHIHKSLHSCALMLHPYASVKHAMQSSSTEGKCKHGMQASAGGTTLGVPITELALLNTFTLLLWQLKAVQEGAAQEGSADPAVGLGERVLSFCLQLESIFEASGELQRLQDCIFRIQADAFLVFSRDKLEVDVRPPSCPWKLQPVSS